MQDNNDVIEQLKKKAEADAKAKTDKKTNTQTTHSSVSSDDDIKALLKKQYLKGNENNVLAMSEDYSFDTVDFGIVDEEYITGEIRTQEQVHTENSDDADTEVAEAEDNDIYIENSADKTDDASVQDGSDGQETADEESTDEELTDDESTDGESADEPEEMDAIAAAVDEAVLENDEELDDIAESVISDRESQSFDNDDTDAAENSALDTEEPETVEDKTLGEHQDKSEDDAESIDCGAQSEQDISDEPREQDNDASAHEIKEAREYGLEQTRIMDAHSSNDGAWDDTYDDDMQIPAPVYLYTAMNDEEEKVSEPEPEYEAIDEESVDFDGASGEPVDYDNVLEGQQGTVFNEYVEDFTGDLDDVVLEPEITESQPPDKQFTIFGDVIPPTEEEEAHSKELAKNLNGNTDYFNTANASELDATDIALMVALGGDKELNQTVGFEKILQAVHDADEEDDKLLRKKDIYGCLGDEYTSVAQNSAIKKKYKKDKTRLIVQLSLTALLALALVLYEITGWIGLRLGGIFNLDTNPEIYVLAGLQMLFLCAAISYNKFIRLFKNIAELSSTAFIGALILLFINISHDLLVLAVGYAEPGATFHSASALLMLISLIYDLFELSEQANVFNVIADNPKKLMLEPYGKLRVSEDDTDSEIIDKDSYCISRAGMLSNFFKRVSRPSPANSARLVALVLSITVSLCVMLVLLLMGEGFATIVLGFVITLSFTLVCSAIFETEFASFIVHKILKRRKTGIIGKASIVEYSKCNIVYFDDFNVFDKESVKTRGLKLYDNSEIYRVLYNAQAVFSKVGGPLKGVFEFATSEMKHSQNVVIKELNKDGIGAVVDGKTTVLIGTATYMNSKGISPRYAPLDMRTEGRGEDGIMFISLNGSISAKLYVKYQFSSKFEMLARKLNARGVSIGIRSCDPNVNERWAKRYSKMKKMDISTVRPTLNEISKPAKKTVEGGLVSGKNVSSLIEALMLCIRLDRFESLVSKMRTVFVVLTGILSFALVLLSGINAVSMLALTLETAFCASLMMLLTHFYIKQ